MRKNQPVFVVEYKGGRRQKGAEKTSIWGSVDFASLTKEIEDDLPVWASTEVSAASDDTETPPVELHLPDRDAVGQEPEAPTVLAEEVSYSSNAADETRSFRNETVEKHEEDTAVLRSPLQAKTPASNSEHSSPDGSAAAVLVPGESDIGNPRAELVSKRELAALIVENVELKRLLKHRLDTENRVLREMIERYPR